MDESQKTQILYDHYKDTFSLTQIYNQSRDTFFYTILAILALVSFQLFEPNQSLKAIEEIQKKKLEISTPINVSFILSVIWFGLSGLVLIYFQRALQVDRWFDYITTIEKEINKFYNADIFHRESSAYFDKFKIFTKWAKFFYTFVFPILLISLSFFRSSYVIHNYVKNNFLFYMDIVTPTCITISSLFYMLIKHKRFLLKFGISIR